MIGLSFCPYIGRALLVMLLYGDVEHVWWRHRLTELFSLMAFMRSMKNSLRGPPPSTALSHRKVTRTCFLSSKVHFTAQRASSHMLLLRTCVNAHTCRPTTNANILLGSAWPTTLQHFMYSRVIFRLMIQFLQEVNKRAVNIEK